MVIALTTLGKSALIGRVRKSNCPVGDEPVKEHGIQKLTYAAADSNCPVVIRVGIATLFVNGSDMTATPEVSARRKTEIKELEDKTSGVVGEGFDNLVGKHIKRRRFAIFEVADGTVEFINV